MDLDLRLGWVDILWLLYRAAAWCIGQIEFAVYLDRVVYFHRNFSTANVVDDF